MVIALQQFDSTIHHLGNSISNSFVDPLWPIGEVPAILASLSDRLSPKLRNFMFIHLSDIKNASAAILLLGIKDDDSHIAFITSLYNAHHPVLK